MGVLLCIYVCIYICVCVMCNVCDVVLLLTACVCAHWGVYVMVYANFSPQLRNLKLSDCV